MDKQLPPSEKLSEFLNFVNEALTLYPFYCEEIQKYEDITQDLLHSLELDGLTYKERAKVATQIATIRRKRRWCKDRVEELQPIVDFFSDPANKKALNKLTQVLGAVRKKEEYHERRSYKPRVLKKEDDNG